MTLASQVPLTIHGTGRSTSEFDRQVRNATNSDLGALTIDTVQVNIGLSCDLACHHCHVEASPARTEAMSWETMRLVLDAAREADAATLDITGGAPEMHPRFQQFVEAAVRQRLHVIVRTNLTILLQSGYETTPEFLAQQGVHLVASLPCYLEGNVDRQRGRQVYHRSIDAIRRLDALGYGTHPRLRLDLVYNPGDASLPPPQDRLEQEYRRELFSRFGIHFNQLYTITNMPIGRFLHDLKRESKAATYEQLLRDSFNPATLDGLMCRHQLHVGWDGTLYDCDFNFAMGLPAEVERPHICNFDPRDFLARRISTAAHCFGCTAGRGSSCKGSLASGD